MASHGVELSIFFAGTAGSVPTARRGLPAILLRRGADRILFDCGEGTQRQLVGSVGLADVSEIFLTHLHTDHWLGLPGMLNTFNLRGRDRPLAVHGPPGITQLMELVRRMSGRPGFELRVVELGHGEVLERDGYRIAPIEVDHRGPALGYVVWEDERPGVFDPATAQAAGIVPGPDFGRLQRGETVRGVAPEEVMGPARSGRRLVLSGDTRPSESLAIAAAGADVLVHEATFAEEERARASDNGHSTARQAAELARDAQVRLLALNHVSTRHPLGLLRDEARAVFPDTVVPRDFDTVEIPYAERGGPRLVRWSDREPEPAPAPCPTLRGIDATPSVASMPRTYPQSGAAGRAAPATIRPRCYVQPSTPLTRSREARKEQRWNPMRPSSSAATTCAVRSCGSPMRSSRRTPMARSRSSASTAAAPISPAACRRFTPG